MWHNTTSHSHQFLCFIALGVKTYITMFYRIWVKHTICSTSASDCFGVKPQTLIVSVQVSLVWSCSAPPGTLISNFPVKSEPCWCYTVSAQPVAAPYCIAALQFTSGSVLVMHVEVTPTPGQPDGCWGFSLALHSTNASGFTFCIAASLALAGSITLLLKVLNARWSIFYCGWRFSVGKTSFTKLKKTTDFASLGWQRR